MVLESTPNRVSHTLVRAFGGGNRFHEWVIKQDIDTCFPAQVVQSCCDCLPPGKAGNPFAHKLILPFFLGYLGRDLLILSLH